MTDKMVCIPKSWLENYPRFILVNDLLIFLYLVEKTRIKRRRKEKQNDGFLLREGVCNIVNR